MAKSKKQSKEPGRRAQPVPPGATRKAFDREDNGGGPIGDHHAAGTPAGGTEVGGLGGTNINEGAPTNADLEEVMGTGTVEPETDGGRSYAGIARGAVGGTPAEGRSAGGMTHRGLKPGGIHRGDSTIGCDPNLPTE
jgi:hypothetical protein